MHTPGALKNHLNKCFFYWYEYKMDKEFLKFDDVGFEKSFILSKVQS